MTIALIVNPSAGGGRASRVLEGVQAALRSHGLEHRVERTTDLDDARRLARAAAAAGETAVALGGDGLIGAVAGAISGTDGVLGVVPGGRGNDFARTLGIPLDPEGACDVLARGTVRALDLGEVSSPDTAPSTFIGIASCGFDSVANRIANETRLVRGNLVYAYGALLALIGWSPASFTLKLDDGVPRSVTGYTIAVANSKAYGGGMWLAPDASLTDGMLDIVIVEHASKLRFLRLLPTVFKGDHVKEPNVHVAGPGRSRSAPSDRSRCTPTATRSLSFR